MIPHEYIEELTRRTDIVELVGSYVQLKRKGRLYGGVCPFHSEKSPSFYVYPDTQSFYCFGCGAGGDAITFAKKINSIDYPEAVKMLAARAGMPEPQEDDKTGRMRSRILSMNKEAARFFHACLNSTVEEARQARAYWRRRGLDDKTIVRFGLGYAPNDGQALYQFLRDKGYNQQELDASGLFKRSPSGRIYCLFWKRVMTPIFDLRGNIIAFGGRVLDDSKPKYVNSPETLVYHKSDTVFALQIAKRSASRRFVLCEGYMDVISMQQAGIDTAVCACGTALTPDQVRLISEYADEVILSYDSDEAGQKATLRSLELFRNSPVKVGVLQIPGAKDPDEYIKKYGAERFKALLDGVGNALDFRLGRLRSQYDLSQDAQRLEYVKQAVDLLAERSSPTEQEVYAGRLAEETNISKTAIMTQLETAVKRVGSKRRYEKKKAVLQSGEMNQIKVSYTAGGSQALGIVSAQQRLLAAILREPQYLDLVKDQLTAEQFIQPGHIIVRLVHGAADLVRGQGLAPGVCRQRPGQFLGLRQFLHDSCSFPLLLQPEGKAGLILLRTRAPAFFRASTGSSCSVPRLSCWPPCLPRACPGQCGPDTAGCHPVYSSHRCIVPQDGSVHSGPPPRQKRAGRSG